MFTRFARVPRRRSNDRVVRVPIGIGSGDVGAASCRHVLQRGATDSVYRPTNTVGRSRSARCLVQ